MFKFLKKNKNANAVEEMNLIDIPFKTTKKNIHTFFKSIRNHQNDMVKAIVINNKDFVLLTRPDLPKKDNDQTGLQVSFKVENFEIAEFLIQQGADLNHIAETIDEWNMPVLHECIRAVIFQSLTLKKNTDSFEKAFGLLKLMLERGADPNGIDSYGNSCLMRAFLDSRQMIDHPNFNENSGVVEQLKRVFDLLIEKGADKEYSNEKREKVVERIKAFEYEKYNWL
ncbi:hypothetical protein [Flagellimonas okinawensis]|uniref:Ankyrin repeat domain-containing protein n=1 Tax=Flagellimonas okinawensis TaxID=3031324 RepID=A0ABT5XRU7_9FLAO|nr:hypothetical protein [[Muricauda] okinawensis]MDF0708530.1 hypothetical protein [[Muricauda] okinawensis]